MNTIRIMPTANALKLDTWKGLSQDALGCSETAGWCPVPTRTSATTEKTSSMPTSMDSSAFWKLAETSMPR